MPPSGSSLVHALSVVAAAVWVLFEIRQSLNQRPEARSADRASRFAVRLSFAIAVLVAIIVKRSAPSATITPDGLVSWIGLTLMCGGIGLRIWSFHTLSRYFTFTVQTSRDQPVISAGPYRLIRHPGYAGLLLTVIGVGFLAISNWASLAVLATVASTGLVYRMPVEEHALERGLGGRYQSYAGSRKRLVPFIW